MAQNIQMSLHADEKLLVALLGLANFLRVQWEVRCVFLTVFNNIFVFYNFYGIHYLVLQSGIETQNEKLFFGIGILNRAELTLGPNMDGLKTIVPLCMDLGYSQLDKVCRLWRLQQ